MGQVAQHAVCPPPQPSVQPPQRTTQRDRGRERERDGAARVEEDSQLRFPFTGVTHHLPKQPNDAAAAAARASMAPLPPAPGPLLPPLTPRDLACVLRAITQPNESQLCQVISTPLQLSAPLGRQIMSFKGLPALPISIIRTTDKFYQHFR